MASHILFLVSALCILSVSADVFVSIDCGSSDTYTDENLIVWTGDDSYIQNGESQVVQNSNSISPVMDTLRVFTTRKKNCYSVEANKGEKVLVRASFYYGNYDKKSSPPTFDLQFDGNYWVTVETSRGYVSVCVAQTKQGQFPFMSALEVRSLDSTMYSHVDQSYPLHLIKRVAYGANGTIRYTDDPYDRIWTPAVGGNGLTNVASDAILIGTGLGMLDHPPPAVLQNAVTALSPSARIQLLMGFPPVEVPVYLNMYFSEVIQLDTTQKRSFQVLMNNEPLLDRPIIPPYENCTELYASNLTVSSNTTFALVPTNDSTLPPLINAMEVFLIGDVLTDGTNSKDVEGLASLQNAFAVLQDWSSDPCLPAPYSWDWINCSSDSTPRITALDFHNNSLDGPIPEFLATLPNLKQLNLASNQFSGPIPDSLSKKNGLNLVVTGNPDLCTSGNSCKTTTSSPTNNPGLSSPGSMKKKNSKLPVILGTTIPIFIIIWAVLGVIIILHHRRKTAAVATFSSGQPGANRPQASPINPQMIGKMGEAIMNEIKINMEDQVNVELADQTNQQANGSTFVR
ncbi:hypothetical protein Pfo_007139 [Paulownia fortunei]|nr:hypothetical protein Pfo_007139 [Paulownia fortunei]